MQKTVRKLSAKFRNDKANDRERLEYDSSRSDRRISSVSFICETGADFRLKLLTQYTRILSNPLGTKSRADETNAADRDRWEILLCLRLIVFGSLLILLNFIQDFCIKHFYSS